MTSIAYRAAHTRPRWLTLPLLAVVLVMPHAVRAQATATVRISSAQLAIGGSVQVTLDVVGADRLAVTTIEVHHDGEVVDATACSLNPDGVFDAGVCNRNFDNDNVGTDIVRLNVASLAPDGVSGGAVIARITFQSRAMPISSNSVLDLSIVTFADPQGSPLPFVEQDGTITLTGLPTSTPASTDTPTVVPTDTMMPTNTAQPTSTFTNSPVPPTATRTATNSPVPSATPTNTLVPTATATSTVVPSSTATNRIQVWKGCSRTSEMGRYGNSGLYPDYPLPGVMGTSPLSRAQGLHSPRYAP